MYKYKCQLSSALMIMLLILVVESAFNCVCAYNQGQPVVGASPYIATPNGAVPWGYNPNIRQYGANPYYNYNYNPYAYGNTGTVYGASPYSNYYGRYNLGGVVAPVYGPPQLIPGGLYGINVGGAPAQFWRAPSGFYYPWAPGYAYTSYPIYVMPPNSNAPSQTLPPVSTVVSDLDSYLDKAKEKGKISSADYQSLRQRSNDLLSKEKSLAYEQGGVIDPDDEAGIRRDIEGLSAEVAHRVRP